MVIIFVITIFQILIFYLASLLLSGQKTIKLKELIVLIFSSVIFTSLYIYIDIHALSALVVPLLIVIRYKYYKDWVGSISSVTFSFLIGLIVEAFIRTFTDEVTLHFILWGFLTILISIFLRWLFVKNSGHELNQSGRIFGTFLGIFMLLAYFLVLVMTEFLELNIIYIRVNLIFFLIYALFTGFIFLAYARTTKKEMDIKEKEIQHKALVEYTDIIEGSARKLRSFRHDFKNFAISMEHFIDARDIEGLGDYYYSEINDNKLLSDSGNLDYLAGLSPSPVKSLIITKLYQAEEQGCKYNLEISSDIRQSKMKESDLVRVLGIFLDNAIDELVKIGDGLLTLGVFELGSQLNIMVVNDCRSDIPPISKLFELDYTDKESGSGIGLANVREILEKYPGVKLSTKVMDNQFIQHLMIEVRSDIVA